MHADYAFGVGEGAVINPGLGPVTGYPMTLQQFMGLDTLRNRRKFLGQIKMNDFIAKPRCGQDGPQLAPGPGAQPGFFFQFPLRRELRVFPLFPFPRR